MTSLPRAPLGWQPNTRTFSPELAMSEKNSYSWAALRHRWVTTNLQSMISISHAVTLAQMAKGEKTEGAKNFTFEYRLHVDMILAKPHLVGDNGLVVPQIQMHSLVVPFFGK